MLLLLLLLLVHIVLSDCCVGMQTAGGRLSWRQRLLQEFRIERKVTLPSLFLPLDSLPAW